MKPRTFFSLCAKFGCLFALGACSPKIADAEAATVPHTLSTLKTADNRPASVYLKKDKPTLIKFWASWCPLCLSELGQTKKWAQDKRFSSANLIFSDFSSFTPFVYIATDDVWTAADA